jgi:hypothetical protein
VTTRKAAAWAFLGSLAIYLIPIVGPHAAFLVFETLRQEFLEFSHPAWAFSALGAALVLQAIAFALLYWFLRTRAILSIAAVIVYALAAVVLVQFIYMLWLPAFFLIEADTSPETGTWTEACSVPDTATLGWRTPRRLPTDGWREIWISDTQNRQWILTMPDCRRTLAPLPQPRVLPGGRADFSIGVPEIVPGGLGLVERTEIPANTRSYFLLNVPAGTLAPLSPLVTDERVGPALFDDASGTAWVVPVPGSPPPVRREIHILPTQGGKETVLDLSPFGPEEYEVIGFDATTNEVLLWVFVPSRFLTVGMDGKERPSPALPAGVKPQSSTVLVSQHGVLAWDAYKEDDNYAIAWSFAGGSGLHRIPKGSRIEAATADADGRYIAFSTSTTLSIGDVRDTVVILRVADGREVFKRFLSRYSRTNVVFIGREYFAYSDGTTTRVLRVPVTETAPSSQ